MCIRDSREASLPQEVDKPVVPQWLAPAETLLNHQKRGMETRLRSRDGRKCRRSFLVPIAIAAMNGRTRAMADALYHPVRRRDIK